MFKKTPLAAAIGSATAYAALASAGIAAPAAMAADDQQLTEEVVVTGSRIRRKDFVSNAPVATIGGEQITITNAVNVENLLNALPQTIPGLDRTSNNPGNGTATVDLRGLGSNRTLVLIDGTRAIPTTGGGTVDINSIPAALIERVEVLTGGASAIYGSDAVAGVVNFILKDDFEGVVIDSGYEVTEEGDSDLWSTNITIGGNFADGRGNAVLNFNYTDRKELFQGDRDFSFFAQFDDTDANGNPILINGGSSGVPDTSIFAAGFSGFSPDSSGIIFNQDGSIRPFVAAGDNNDFYNYAPVNYIQLPQERYQATGKIRYEITDQVEAYGRLMFTSSEVPQQLAPTPAFQTASFTVDDSPFIDAAAQQVISDALGDGVDTDGDGIDDTATGLLRRRLEEVSNRVSDSEFQTYQFQLGFRGDINDNWSFDVYGQRGEVEANEVQNGNINVTRFRQSLLVDTSDPTGQTCTDPSANGSTVGCSPLNIFGAGNISPQAADFLRVAVNSNATFEQTVIAGNISGDSEGWFELPGGAIAMSFGAEYREDSFDFDPSQDLATGNIAGFNGAPPVQGQFDVTSFFGEFYLPILQGEEFAELLDLELAFNFSDYSTVGSVENYKVAGSWAPIEDIRFRASWNTAVRAPSVAELFSPQGEGFPGATDPCAGDGTAPGDPAVAAICTATGVPAGSVGSVALNLPSGQVRQLSGGNPNLAEEEATTYTVGLVWSPTQDALEGLQFSVDYFDIEIEDFISSFGGGSANVLNVCYDPTDPTGGAGSPFCNVVNRRADGTIDFISILQQNVARQTLTGFDLIGSYNFEVFEGNMQIDYVATITTEDDFEPFAGAQVIDCAGFFGNLCGEPRPEYRHRMTFNWGRDNYSMQLSWRYVGEVDDDDDGTLFTIEDLDPESYFDLAGTYGFNENISIVAGIDNLLDTDPPIIGDNQEQANTYPATYDVFGRTYFARLQLTF